MYIDKPRLSSLFLSVCSILVLFSNLHALGYAANVTIDDQYGDELSGTLPEYTPEGSWSQGNGCSSCALHPDSADAFRNSWHDTAFFAGGSERTITINFTGFAVYAFFIVPDESQGHATVATDLIFTLDGEQAGNYSHSPTGGADFLYDVPCFVNENLTNSSHGLVISATAPVNSSSSVLFDYLVYTSSNSSSGASSSESSIHTSHVGAIVGGTIGGIIAVILFLALFLYYRRSRLRRVTPVDLQSPTSSDDSTASLWKFFRPREAPSELEVQPAVFDESKPEDVSSTPRRHQHLQKGSRSAQKNRASSPTSDEQSPVEPRTSNNTTDIASQVAALHATVLSLQEQRLNHHNSSTSDVGAPPAYDV